MKLSTKGHYGLHAIMDLAAHHGQGASLLRDICRPHNFSEKYLEQLLRLLHQAGLVESVRGARGGYWLARPPEEITLLEIVEALEGALSQLPSQCKPECEKRDHCALHETWFGAVEEMRRKLASVTLRDLVGIQRDLDKKHEHATYSI
jgi:Rrf2 family cysteine metabolism transcriptional repressor